MSEIKSFTVLKTNKVTRSFHFETFQDLMIYAQKNRYAQGKVDLSINYQNESVNVPSVALAYDLNSWCTKRFIHGL